jgi:hypothetical protein
MSPIQNTNLGTGYAPNESTAFTVSWCFLSVYYVCAKGKWMVLNTRWNVEHNGWNHL